VDLGLIGYGTLGRQIKTMFESRYVRDITVRFYDDKAVERGVADAFPFSAWSNDEDYQRSFVVALGYKHLRLKCEILDALISKDRNLLTYIHQSCFINADAAISDGTVIYPMCNIDAGVTIGRGVLLNNSVIVSHDCKIGDGSFLAPGVILSGNVSVGSGTFIGSGTVVSNGVSIGRNVTVGVGTCVTRDVADGCSVIGNPMKIVRDGLTLT
jgi:sugar O-acyltransferase (sialic acid O-acetyltransferase NeuD family)